MHTHTIFIKLLLELYIKFIKNKFFFNMYINKNVKMKESILKIFFFSNIFLLLLILLLFFLF